MSENLELDLVEDLINPFGYAPDNCAQNGFPGLDEDVSREDLSQKHEPQDLSPISVIRKIIDDVC
jgi:hypothetical protein